MVISLRGEDSKLKGLNQCIFIGRLGQDPEQKTTTNNRYTSFSLAIDESYKSKDGNKVEKTTWIPCISWGQLADICKQYLKKGSQVCVKGKLDISEYEAEGVKRKVTKIVMDDLIMLGSKERTESSTDSVSGMESSGDLPF